MYPYLSDQLGADIHDSAEQSEHQLGYVKVQVTDQRWELIQYSFVLSRLDGGGYNREMRLNLMLNDPDTHTVTVMCRYM